MTVVINIFHKNLKNGENVVGRHFLSFDNVQNSQIMQAKKKFPNFRPPPQAEIIVEGQREKYLQ